MEAASRLLQQKFGSARALFEKLPAAGVDDGGARALTHELAALEMRFALSTSHLYLLAAPLGEAGRAAAATEFARVLAVEDFAGAADALVLRAEAALGAAGVALRDQGPGPRGRPGAARGRPAAGRPKRAGPERPGPASAAGRARPPGWPQACADVQRLLDVYPRGDQTGEGPSAAALGAVDCTRCGACGGDMAVDAGHSRLRCGDCGMIRELVGTVFDDAQFYSQEGQKAKSGTFNPNRHFQFWWTHILAREPEEEIGDKADPENAYGERLLEALCAIVARDNNKVLRLLTVNDIREMLREVGRTELNKNVPLILKKLTGIGPPAVSDALAVRAENLFTKAIEVSERVRRTGRVNRNYYPYYIMKILDQLIPAADTETRRILYYIYVQSRETVEADDADWEQICLELDELAYVPTDRNLGMRYGPS